MVKFILLILAVAAAPIFASADDKSCLQFLRESVISAQVEYPAGFSDSSIPLGNLPRTDVSYKRIADRSEHTIGLKYDFDVTTAKHILNFESEIEADNDEDSEQHFTVESTTTVYDRSRRELFELKTKVGFNKECAPTPLSRKTSRRIHGAKTVRFITDLEVTGFPAKHSEADADSRLVANSDRLAAFKTARVMLNAGLIGKTVRIADGSDGEVAIADLKFTRAADIRRYDRFQNRIVTMRGLETEFSNIKLAYFASPNPDFEIAITTTNENIRLEEMVPFDFWSRIPIDRVYENVDVQGFANDDFALETRNLGVIIKGAGPTPKLHNMSAYFKDLNAKSDASGWTLSGIQPVVPSTPPNALPVSTPNTPEDQKYLKFGKYIQAEPVKEIVERLRPQVRDLNRLQAAVMILAEVVNTLKYDYGSLKNGLVDIRTVEEVMKERKGVCQHFAAVYVAIARSLGIPARAIHGLALSAKDAGRHAWVEVKYDNDKWWPFEPQKVTSVLSPGYVPVGEFQIYDLPLNATYEQRMKASVDTNAAYSAWMKAHYSKAAN